MLLLDPWLQYLWYSTSCLVLTIYCNFMNSTHVGQFGDLRSCSEESAVQCDCQQRQTCCYQVQKAVYACSSLQSNMVLCTGQGCE